MVSWNTDDYDFIAIDYIHIYIWPNLIISHSRADRDDPQEENGEVNMFSNGAKKSGGELQKWSVALSISLLGEQNIDLFLS